MAGPITDLDYEGAGGWREVAEALLAPELVTQSPLRGIPPGESVAFNTGPHTGGHESTLRDEWDVRTCDAILMNLKDAPKVSIGSMIEAGMARVYRTPLIIVRGDKHIHPMLDEIAYRQVDDLQEAVSTLLVLFGKIG